MKLAVTFLCLVVACHRLAADALTFNEPRKDQSNVLLDALTKLQALELPRLHSHLSDPETTYYLRDASFLGRTDSPQGIKNLIRVTFIRSSPYTEKRGFTPPPRGHSFVIFFSENLDPEYFWPIPSPESAALESSSLNIEGRVYDLTAEATFRTFTPIKSIQRRGHQTTAPKPKPASEAKVQTE
ncbi:MAG: hypothetical protein R3F11_06845 [Verrucomicrobiales bacterium]